MSSFNVVNHPISRIDATAKVTGRAKFTDDLTFDGMLYGRVLRSKHPHAKILELDTRNAENLPGVAAVITYADIPGAQAIGPVRPDMPIFASTRTMYLGDTVAMVVAETPKIAEKALDLIRIEYKELQAIFQVEDALADSAPLLHKDYPGNIVNHYPLRKGDIEEGFKESDVILERTYTTQLIEHAYIEPEAAIAVPGQADGAVTVYGSIQNPFTARRHVAQISSKP